MGGEVPVVSKFGEQDRWLSLAQSKHKEVIQHKGSRQVVEKHYLQHIERSDVTSDSLILQWRKDPNTAHHSVEIFQIRKLSEEEEPTCLAACHIPSKHVDLLIYTEHLFKLYEQNPKTALSERDQLVIFKGIVEGVEMLAQKFGEFKISKDMVGYNASKRGKVWIHQNFCMNTVQQKRVVKSKEQRVKWQREVVQGLIDICKLCNIEQNIKNCKFSYVMEMILKNKLYKFSAFRQFEEFKEIDTKQTAKERNKPKEQNFSKDVQLSNSQRVMASNELVSTDEGHRVKIFNKTFDVPMVLYDVPDRDRSMQQLHHLRSFNKSKNKKTQGKVGPKQASFPAHHRQNYSQINKTQYNALINEISLNDAADFNRQHRKLVPIRQQAPHYAILNELHQSRSSRSENKMIAKENIKMVDSLMIVQGQDSESYGVNVGKRYAMEEQVVVKGRRK